jgi:hypothetical protein
VAFDRSDDLVIALQLATELFSRSRYDKLAECNGDIYAAEVVTEVADVFLARLRRPASITLTLAAIEEQPAPGGNP